MNQQAHFVVGGERVRVEVHEQSRLSADDPRFSVESTQTDDEWTVGGDPLVDEYAPISERAVSFIEVMVDHGFGTDSE